MRLIRPFAGSAFQLHGSRIYSSPCTALVCLSWALQEHGFATCLDGDGTPDESHSTTA